MNDLSNKLAQVNLSPTGKKKTPVWEGPCSPSPYGGITFSMLSQWLVCRERFRIKYLEGLRVKQGFNHRLEYGNMWHLCEDASARGVNPLHQEPQYPGSKDLTWGELQAYARGLSDRYPMDREKIDHWYNVCKVQFPIYQRYWAKHPDTKDCQHLMPEQVFCVPYTIPSGDIVYLRGKWDGVDLIGTGKNQGIYLFEHKTKSEINEAEIKRQLGFDCQTMMYLVALCEKPSCDLPRKGFYRHSDGEDYQIKGVRYNCIRRPLSGGKHSIVRHKGSRNVAAETKAQFYERLGGVIAEHPEDFFLRFRSEVSQGDIKRFEDQFLIPCLEDLCSWYENQSYAMGSGVNPFSFPGHFRFPFGVWSPLLNGGETDLDYYLDTGSTIGLVQRESLFEELQ